MGQPDRRNRWWLRDRRRREKCLVSPISRKPNDERMAGVMIGGRRQDLAGQFAKPADAFPLTMWSASTCCSMSGSAATWPPTTMVDAGGTGLPDGTSAHLADVHDDAERPTMS